VKAERKSNRMAIKDAIRQLNKEIKTLDDDKIDILYDLMDNIDRRIVSFFKSKSKRRKFKSKNIFKKWKETF